MPHAPSPLTSTIQNQINHSTAIQSNINLKITQKPMLPLPQPRLKDTSFVISRNETHSELDRDGAQTSGDEMQSPESMFYAVADGSEHTLPSSLETQPMASSPPAFVTQKKGRGRPKKLIFDPSTQQYVDSAHPNYKDLNKLLKQSMLSLKALNSGAYNGNDGEVTSSELHAPIPPDIVRRIISQPLYSRRIDDEAVRQLIRRRDRRGRPRKYTEEETGVTIRGIRVNGLFQNEVNKLIREMTAAKLRSTIKKHQERPNKTIFDPATDQYIDSTHPRFAIVKSLNETLKKSLLNMELLKKCTPDESLQHCEESAAVGSEHESDGCEPHYPQNALGRLVSQPTRSRRIDDEAVRQLILKRDRRGRPRKYAEEETGVTIQGIRVNGQRKIAKVKAAPVSKSSENSGLPKRRGRRPRKVIDTDEAGITRT